MKKAAGVLIAIIVIVALWMTATRTPATRAAVGLTLRIAGAQAIDIVPDTPVEIDVTLGGGLHEPIVQIGSRIRPWHQMVRLESADETAPLPWPFVVQGRPTSVTVSGDADHPAQVASNENAVALVGGADGSRRYHRMVYVAGPDARASVRPGVYRIRGVLETPRWMFWRRRERIVSSPVAITVRAASPDERGRILEAQRLAATASFYLANQRFQEALTAARTLVELQPTNAWAHVLTGDALYGATRFTEAARAYGQALALAPPGPEEPRPILTRLQMALLKRDKPTQK